jgi:hypothetical protein
MVRRANRSFTRLRCSLKYSPRGGFPVLIGYPFARLDIYDDRLTFSAGRLLSVPRWTVQRDRITKLERTQRGVRFYAEGFDSPWLVASFFRDSFLDRLREHGIVAEGPIVPSTWTTI